jgi:hypothetical protein
MPRPHIEFLHAQQLPWTGAPFAGAAWRGTQVKILSRDPVNGACTLLWRLSARSSPDPFRLAALAELYVLDGDVQIDGQHCGLDGYTVRPAGMPWRIVAGEDGAVLLAFMDREPAAAVAALTAADAAWDADLYIAPIDTHRMPWTSHDIDPSVQFLRLTHKVLRHRPVTGEKTLLLSTGAQTHPRDWAEAQLRHDCVEEMYLLGGDIIGERGTIYEGGYFWRPPRLWHGPFGSRRGSLSLIRFAEGQHANEWGAVRLPFTLTPAHAVALPEELAAAAGAAWTPARY